MNEINKLFIVGLDASLCVNSTMEGARNSGYGIAVISDAILSDPDSMKYHMLERFDERELRLSALMDSNWYRMRYTSYSTI